MSAAHAFRYARMRRSGPSRRADNGLDTRQGEHRPQQHGSSSAAQLEGVAHQPRSVAQRLIVAGLAASEASTVTGVSGAVASGEVVAVAERRVARAASDAPVFLERRSRPRNGHSVRTVNVAIALVLLILLSPLMLLIAVAVRLTSSGPVIYKQVRVGRDRRGSSLWTSSDRRSARDRRRLRGKIGNRRTGLDIRDRARQSDADRHLYTQALAMERRHNVDRRHHDAEHPPGDVTRRGRIATAVHDRRTWNTCGQAFTMYKFRTMRVDAEADTGAVWAQQHDARVTPIGGFLRRCRLDELPQLFNVLRGDMNIVGPRPERPTIIPNLVDSIAYYPIRQRTRPGITGLAQIRHSYDRSIDDVKAKVRYDLEYLRRRSVFQDLRIMVQTPVVMFFRRTGH